MEDVEVRRDEDLRVVVIVVLMVVLVEIIPVRAAASGIASGFAAAPDSFKGLGFVGDTGVMGVAAGLAVTS